MKKKLLIISIVTLIIIGVSIVLSLIFQDKNQTFSLESKYYNTGEKITINETELESLINDKESFVLFVSQTMCLTSYDFEVVINEFLNEFPITIYEINYSELKESNLGNFLKYYPSFVIYKKGKVVDFLDANDDEDTSYYKSSEEFKKWFTKYVDLKKYANNSSNDSNQNDVNNSNQNDTDLENENIELGNVVREENKVNIYFFWGNGCPHCEVEIEFFDSIEKEYGKYYNLYKFETWYDEENAKIFNIFTNAMGDNANGVPYTIIGEKSFSGFNESFKEEFIKAIEEQYKNNYDVYFDEIKK